MATDVIDLFLRAASDHADRPAIASVTHVLTYAELKNRVDSLAFELLAVNSHPRVAIYLPQGEWAYAAMFATLLAGGVYAPINLGHPESRQSKVIQTFDPHVIVVDGKSRLPAAIQSDRQMRIVSVEELQSQTLKTIPTPDNLAYVMFTSGSTGQPKGVMIQRSALSHYVEWAHEAMQVKPEDRWSQHPNIGFDLSVLDVYGALCAGAALFPLTARKHRLLPATAIADFELTIWNSVPSVIDLMLRANQVDGKHLQSLRLMTFCGEPLLRQHLASIFAVRPDLVVHNTYGPTEATVSTTLIKLTVSNFHRYSKDSVALGEPIGDMRVYLEEGETADEGELVIAGPQVAQGYWKDEMRTLMSFFEGSVDGVMERCYKTGDLVERIDGNLYFVSRMDRQIKRHGNRIELGDIDVALRQAGAPAACTVFVSGWLVGFVENVDEDHLNEVSSRLRQLLPSYALPDELLSVPVLPRNSNDKIDPAALEQVVIDQNVT